ncbi:MAG: putative lipid II flippase FtsW [Elusimicrobia bacterium]|nr:putative lipid II flippase FtsW [Elusimicrobiota bacterium]
MKRRGQLDYQLLTLALVLTVFGLIMMYSASGIWADRHFHDPFHFIKRQILFAILGVPAMLALSRIDYNRLKEWIWPAFGLCVLTLVAVLFAAPVAGARRWIRLGTFGFQPAEFAKVVMVLFLADYLDRKRSKVDSPVHGAAIPWAVMGVLLALILVEPDLGTPFLMFLSASLILFIGGARSRYILGVVAASLPVLAYELLKYPYRRQRLMHFLQPSMDAQGAGYQVVQSLLAVGSGGWIGKGLGASTLKLMFLPAPHTDFIFPIVAEELGLAGSIAVLTLFALLFLRGMRIARAAPNLFGELLAAGLSIILCLQAFFNIAMSIGLLPTKGVALPFFSYGGSTLLVNLLMIGILLSISRQAKVAH